MASDTTQAVRAPREEPTVIGDFPCLQTLTTRWHDVDIYGHINNVVYYAYFDTAVNAHLIAEGVLDPQTNSIIGLVAETRCNYFRSLTFPQPVQAGLRVVHLGTSSVRYQIALFQGEDERAAAQGHFVHVYVKRGEQRPVPIPAETRAVLERLKV
ncbi:acyl-CoA thioesterase [Xanthobacter sp. TB0139]|uniref:acyl-CoA thioesterase n=1 Tax=Xanthobacter sp. TB0139 TaxID=3459178 RepID=UPI00403A5AA6